MGSRRQVNSPSHLLKALEDLASQSCTIKLWVDTLIKPVLIMMLFIRTEREADWPLCSSATTMMMSFFSGHFSYARYCLYYCHSLSKLPGPVQDKSMMGNYVMHHQRGIWHGLW